MLRVGSPPNLMVNVLITRADVSFTPPSCKNVPVTKSLAGAPRKRAELQMFVLIITNVSRISTVVVFKVMILTLQMLPVAPLPVSTATY